MALDTGYNDFDPLKVDSGATWVQDFDTDNPSYSELVWHNHKLRTAAADGKQRRTVLLSHHQPFTRQSPIAKSSAVNQRLVDQFSHWFPQIALWLWGHEHNQVIYAPFLGLEKGRCIGASAIPVSSSENIYSIADAFLDAAGRPNQPIPDLLQAPRDWKLSVDATTDLWNLGYALLSLDKEHGRASPSTESGTRQT